MQERPCPCLLWVTVQAEGQVAAVAAVELQCLRHPLPNTSSSSSSSYRRVLDVAGP